MKAGIGTYNEAILFQGEIEDILWKIKYLQFFYLVEYFSIVGCLSCLIIFSWKKIKKVCFKINVVAWAYNHTLYDFFTPHPKKKKKNFIRLDTEKEKSEAILQEIN